MSSSSCSGEQEQEAEPIRIEKKRNGTGRKKIETKKIEKKSSRQVAFSKRRKGLFKKGCELCRLCDAMLAIIVFSPKGRVYSYGHPSVDGVIDQFQREEDEENQYNVGDEGGSVSLSHEEKCETDCVSENSTSEEEEEEEEYWWEEDIEGLELEGLERRRASMEELRDNVASSLEDIMERRFCERDLLGNDGDLRY